MMLIKIFVLSLSSCIFAQELHVGAPNVHPSLTGNFFRSIGDFKHQEANAVDKIINKIKLGGGEEHTAPGDILRGFGDFKYRVADAADNVVGSVQNKVAHGKSLFGGILQGFLHQNHPTEEQHTAQLSPSSPLNPPSVSLGISPTVTYLPDNTLYPYPDIKKPASPRFIFIYNGGQRDLTIDEIIDAGKYLEEVKKLASNNEVNA